MSRVISSKHWCDFFFFKNLVRKRRQEKLGKEERSESKNEGEERKANDRKYGGKGKEGKMVE